jgi:Xaa-Pro aminopeptidase
MQDALLVLKRSGEIFYFARRSFERAVRESPLKNIYPMNSYRDCVPLIGNVLGNVYIEDEVMPYAMVSRILKNFTVARTGSLERVIKKVRAVKTPYELFWMKESGLKHQKLMTEILPSVLQEGMTESELFSIVFYEMIKSGYQGVSRFSAFGTEIVAGQLAFGENSLYPTNFDGPGGAMGTSAASPVGGSRERKLKKGDLVFVDISFGVNGYHTDKTQIYSFGREPKKEAVEAHALCMDIQKRIAEQLRPDVIPSEIYFKTLESLTAEQKQNFMGLGAAAVKFIGHGVGLVIDEYPVIAKGFDEPLKEHMTLAIEPKIAVPGIGLTGVEDTYVVTKDGGVCLTGGGREIIKA